jgi:hypothetical protein
MMEETKEQMLSEVWDYRVHPILGYIWKQPAINHHEKTKPHEFEAY